jgi:hypothetical protein
MVSNKRNSRLQEASSCRAVEGGGADQEEEEEESEGGKGRGDLAAAAPHLCRSVLRLKLCSVALWTKRKRRRNSATPSCWKSETEDEDGCCVGSWDFGVVVLVVPRRSIYNGRWRARRACGLLRKIKCLPI